MSAFEPSLVPSLVPSFLLHLRRTHHKHLDYTHIHTPSWNRSACLFSDRLLEVSSALQSTSLGSDIHEECNPVEFSELEADWDIRSRAQQNYNNL